MFGRARAEQGATGGLEGRDDELANGARRTRETGRDRRAMAAEAGYGRASLVSVLAGTLVAYGAFALLLAVAASIAKGVGVSTDLSNADWQRLGLGGGLVVAALLLLSYLFGGYVAGRMSRRAGIVNGMLVFALGVLIAAGVAGFVSLFSDTADITRNLRSVGVPTSMREWGQIGTVAGIASLAAMLVGAVLGGGMGERWHGTLLARADDPEIGPAAEARREHAHEQSASEPHVEPAVPDEPARRATIVDDGTSVVSRSGQPDAAAEDGGHHAPESDHQPRPAG